MQGHVSEVSFDSRVCRVKGVPGRRVLIVGGGASGALTALRLLQSRTAGLHVTLVERSESQLGRGIAFRTDAGELPLNVRASGMSLYDERPGHFVEWLLEHRSQYAATSDGVSPHAFMPRRIFGDYLGDELRRSVRDSSLGLSIVTDEVVGLSRLDDCLDVQLQRGGSLKADRVVLALGNAPCASSLDESGAWGRAWVESLGGTEKLVFIGAGLTTVDHLLSLRARGHRGHVLVISRHGRWPCTHSLESGVTMDEAELLENAGSARSLAAHLRKLGEREPQATASQLIDGIRPYASAIWGRWSLLERRVFMEHLRHFWDIHRHRIPRESAAVINGMTADGQLELLAGRVRSVSQGAAEDTEIAFLPRGSARLRIELAHRVIRCIGPESNYSRISAPLVADLRQSGWIVPDPLGLGIESDSQGRVLGSVQGFPAEQIFAIGPMRRGTLWESTSIPEIRGQACELAKHLIESLDCKSLHQWPDVPRPGIRLVAGRRREWSPE